MVRKYIILFILFIIIISCEQPFDKNDPVEILPKMEITDWNGNNVDKLLDFSALGGGTYNIKIKNSGQANLGVYFNL